MRALVDDRLAEAAVRPGASQRHQQAAGSRRRVRTAPPGRMAQPVRQGRPLGVRGPGIGQRESLASRQVPPAVLDMGVRLSDRGIALALAMALVLVVVALACVGSTAWRVTADPAPTVASVASR